MKIIFVTGPALSGKTIYANTHYPDAMHITIEAFKEVLAAAESNDEVEKISENIEHYCKDTLTEAIAAAKEDDEIVLEHPMLTKAERAFFVKGVRETTDAPIDCILMCPDDETIHKMLFGQPLTIKLYEFERSKLEMPDTDEGFATVKVVNPVIADEYLTA